MMRLLTQEYATDTYFYEQRMEGFAEGLAEGKSEERIKNIRGLKESGLPDDFIAKALGIPIDEVQAIAKNKKEDEEP